jgi:hypothetical protein
MLADHAARILAGSPGFGAEARRPGGEAQRQIDLVDNFIGDEIGERNLRGRDVEGTGCSEEEIVDEFRQATGAESVLVSDH